ncbi:MAG: hypothetical protein JXN65_09810 [Clostridia bacterium]|nr:hypothetical protein [Clostridia bacterium]
MIKTRIFTFLFSLVIISALFLVGCTSSELTQADEFSTNFNTPEYTPIPTIESTAVPEIEEDITMKEVSVEDGLITLKLPESFSIMETHPAQIFTASDHTSIISTSDYTMNIIRFYQKEDPNCLQEYPYVFEKPAEMLAEGVDCKITRIKEDVSFGDGVGFISKIEVSFDKTKYAATIIGPEAYYKATIYSEGTFSNDEDLIISILESIQLDAEIEKMYADDFEVKFANNRYYSSRKDGASIGCPDGWTYSESTLLSSSDSIMSIVTDDNYGSITVNCYPKNLYAFEDMNDFIVSMLEKTYKRGLIEEINLDDIYRDFSEESGRIFFVYTTKIGFVHFFMEYEDAYYCVEALYSGSNEDQYMELLTVSDSFSASEKEYLFDRTN